MFFLFVAAPMTLFHSHGLNSSVAKMLPVFKHTKENVMTSQVTDNLNRETRTQRKDN